MSTRQSDFYARYGLQNVREAMKRPFEQAFSDAVAHDAPRPASPPSPPLPQLRSRPPAPVTRWTWHVESIYEPAAKRRRTDAFDSLPQALPTPNMPTSAPVLWTLPQAMDTSPQASVMPAQAPAAGVHERRSIGDVTEAVFNQYAQWLGMHSASDRAFLKSVADSDRRFFASDADRMAFAEKLIALIDSLAGTIESGVDGRSDVLEARLVENATKYLRRFHDRRAHNAEAPGADNMKKMVLELCNKNWVAFGLLQRYASSEAMYAYRFAGGTGLFKFMGWCVKNRIRLNKEEMNCLCGMRVSANTINFSALHTRIRLLAGVAEVGRSTRPASGEKPAS